MTDTSSGTFPAMYRRCFWSQPCFRSCLPQASKVKGAHMSPVMLTHDAWPSVTAGGNREGAGTLNSSYGGHACISVHCGACDNAFCRAAI